MELIPASDVTALMARVLSTSINGAQSGMSLETARSPYYYTDGWLSCRLACFRRRPVDGQFVNQVLWRGWDLRNSIRALLAFSHGKRQAPGLLLPIDMSGRPALPI